MENKFIIDHDLHIHSYLSSCSKNPEQNAESILSYAKASGLKTICITDHFWDESVDCASAQKWNSYHNYQHISSILPLPSDSEVDFLFGCEADMDMNMTLGISAGRMAEFDFVIVSTTHLHMHSPEADNSNPDYRAKLWAKRLEALLGMDLPFSKIGIAHLTCFLINRESKEAYRETLRLIPQSDMLRLFRKAAVLGVGIELNKDDMSYLDYCKEEILRVYQTAKSCGCKFYLGSDAHHPEEFNGSESAFAEIINFLNLTEADKFIPKNPA